ncbi:MAG: hypothetical protein PWP14_40 [Methanolobus sp.]|nr:hypothetical protein [Methanolobus sp.]
MGWISWGNWNDWNDWGEWSNTTPDLTDALETRFGEYTEIITAIAVKIPVAWYDENQGIWIFSCGLKSVGKVQLQPEAPPYLDGWGSYFSTLEIEKVNSGDPTIDFGFLSAISKELYYGSYPHGGNHANYESVELLQYLADLAVSKIRSYISYALDAAQLIALLCGGPDDSYDGPERMEAEFIYYPAYSPESSCWYKWYTISSPNNVVRFTLKYLFYGLEMLPPCAYGIGCLITYAIPTASPPEIMSAAEKEKYGIIEIPVDAIEKRAPEFGISATEVNEQVKLGKTLYVMINPEVKAESCRIEKKKVITEEEKRILEQKGWDFKK